MNTIGQKIKEARKQKGLSQEALAESATVNLRTIQRIENNESEPRGKTLNLICQVLDINAEDILDFGKREDANYLIIFHLSVVAFLIIPVGNIILPSILWITKKDQIIGLKSLGANLLNFQIVWSIFTYGSGICFAFLKIMHYNNANFFIYALVGLYVVNIVLPIIFAVNTKNSKKPNRYPTLIKLLSN